MPLSDSLHLSVALQSPKKAVRKTKDVTPSSPLQRRASTAPVSSVAQRDSASSHALCITCQKLVKICLVCGEEIKGRYLEFDGVGPYCLNCQKHRAPCDICTAPLTIEHWLLSDGRTMCTHCHITAVYEHSNATILYDEMKAVVAQLLDIRLNVPTGLALVDRNQLAEVIRGVITSAGEPGLHRAEELDAQRTLGIYARKGIRRGIYIQTGLPRLLFLQVAAHEYAHAWQGENCPLLAAISSGVPVPSDNQEISSSAGQSSLIPDIHGSLASAGSPAGSMTANQAGKQADGRLVHEGFAEWVAYQVLGHYGYHRGQDRMLTRTDLYGQGLRWALEVETSCGIQGLLDACRKAHLEPDCESSLQKTAW